MRMAAFSSSYDEVKAASRCCFVGRVVGLAGSPPDLRNTNIVQPVISELTQCLKGSPYKFTRFGVLHSSCLSCVKLIELAYQHHICPTELGGEACYVVRF